MAEQTGSGLQTRSGRCNSYSGVHFERKSQMTTQTHPAMSDTTFHEPTKVRIGFNDKGEAVMVPLLEAYEEAKRIVRWEYQQAEIVRINNCHLRKTIDALIAALRRFLASHTQAGGDGMCVCPMCVDARAALAAADTTKG